MKKTTSKAPENLISQTYERISKELSDIKSLTSKFPNDQDLGRELRKHFATQKHEIDFIALAKRIGITPGSKDAFDDFNGGC
jgi:hypothetical protein